MKKKNALILCLVIFGCIAADLWCDSLKDQIGTTYIHPPIYLMNLYIFSPLLWGCIGVLAGASISIGEKVSASTRNIMRILAFAFVLVYVVSIIWLRLTSDDSVGFAWRFGYMCTAHSQVFAIPGVVLGLSFGNKKALQSKSGR